MESPESDPHEWANLIYDRGGTTNQCEKDRLFNKCSSTCKNEMKFLPHTIQKNNYRWIKDLRIYVLKLENKI